MLAAGWGRLAGWSEFALRFTGGLFWGVLLAPLLAVLALLLARRRGAAALAALLAALHPLLVYYGQEARMYTLLAALAVTMAWLLAAAAGRPRPGWRLWLAYVVVATAAVYTHYFAFFLILGLGAAYLADRAWHARLQPGSRSRRAGPGSFLLANALVLLLYLPWITVLVTRLRVDRSYWTGVLKLQEALLDVAISFTSGLTVTEQMGSWLLVGYALVTVWALWLLWRGGRDGRRVLLYAGAWIAVPLAAVLALAYNVPKFNARYVLIALPGLLLIWAAGLDRGLVGFSLRRPAYPGQPRSEKASATFPDSARIREGQAQPPAAPGGRAAGCLQERWRCCWLVFSSPTATGSSTGPLARRNGGDLAAFLRPRLEPDDVIVLVSGHAWPVWEYYASDLPTVRLPELEILDVDAVLDFANTAPTLKAAFGADTDRRDAWLVGWQDEVVDPNGIVPIQLELAGREKGQSLPFYGISLRRFSNVWVKHIADSPPIDHPMAVDFGGQVSLRGYTAMDNGDLLLFWARPAACAGRGRRSAVLR